MTRIFSVKRAAASCVLGVLLPLGYAVLLSEVDDYFFPNGPPPDFMVWPLGWPRPLWIFLTGRQPLESGRVTVMTFAIASLILLYGALAYAGLTVLSAMRRKRAEYAPPPPPEPVHPTDG